MAGIQHRRGPNIVGFLGSLQPFADGLKLICKELLIPRKSSKFLFLISPIITLFLSFTGWCVIPYNYNNVICNVRLGILFIILVNSLGVYGILLSGWSSNSKYGFIGSIRSIAQMISYELSFGLILITLVLCCGTLNLQAIVYWQETCVWFLVPFFPLFIIFFICILAETNRVPFDLPEAEAEIVAGYNVEYSSITFALFFLGEYSSMLLMSAFFIILFLGGWTFPFFKNLYYIFVYRSICFSLKLIFICYLFIVIRASFPRYRYDQLMDIGWKVFLPLCLSYIIITTFILEIFNGFPIII